MRARNVASLYAEICNGCEAQYWAKPNVPDAEGGRIKILQFTANKRKNSIFLFHRMSFDIGTVPAEVNQAGFMNPDP